MSSLSFLSNKARQTEKAYLAPLSSTTTTSCEDRQLVLGEENEENVNVVKMPTRLYQTKNGQFLCPKRTFQELLKSLLSLGLPFPQHFGKPVSLEVASKPLFLSSVTVAKLKASIASVSEDIMPYSDKAEQR